MGRWGSLQKLDLFNNQIGDAGMKAFSDAIAMGALPALKELYVFGNLGDETPATRAFADRIQ